MTGLSNITEAKCGVPWDRQQERRTRVHILIVWETNSSGDRHAMGGPKGGDITRVTVVVVGDSLAGKSAMAHAFVHRCFPEESLSTALDQMETLLVCNGETVYLNLWDTPGSSAYDALRPLTYPEADAVLVCFALDNRESLVNVEQKWAPEIRESLPNVPIILVGNKQDLRNSDQQPLCEVNNGQTSESFVSTSEGTAVSQCVGATAYVECSALVDQCLDEVFHAAIEAALKRKVRKKKCCRCCCCSIL